MSYGAKMYLSHDIGIIKMTNDTYMNIMNITSD